MSGTFGKEQFASLCSLVSSRTGLRIGPELHRRLESIIPRRMALGNYRQSSEYFLFLRDDPFSRKEFAWLASMLTARKPRLMERCVAASVRVAEPIARLIEPRPDISAGGRPTVAVLAIGAAAADDIYSAAIMLAQSGVELGSQHIVLCGADFALDRLLRAADGIYTCRALAALDPAAIDRFFEQLSPHRYRARPLLRDSIRWLYVNPLRGWTHHLSARPWDLLLCRRFLGYLNRHGLETWSKLGRLAADGGIVMADRRLRPAREVSEAWLAVDRRNGLWLHRKPARAPEPAPASTPGAEPGSAGAWETAAAGDPGDVTQTLESVKGVLEWEDRAAAENYIESVVAHNPFNASYRTAMAVLLLRKKATDQAKAHALAALALDPHSPEALLACGMTYESLDRLRTAEQFYRKALIVRPTMAAAHLQLAELYRRTDREPEASRICQRLRDGLGEQPAVQITVASALRRVFRVSVGPADGTAPDR